MFAICPGDEFDLGIPRSLDPNNDWGIVNNQWELEDCRTMFWATTDPEQALAWSGRYRWRLGPTFDRVFVWEVDLDDPEVDVNVHDPARRCPGETVTSVMAASGRFVRLVQQMTLAEYKRWLRDRDAATK